MIKPPKLIAGWWNSSDKTSYWHRNSQWTTACGGKRVDVWYSHSL